jgi:hypothetical protein
MPDRKDANAMRLSFSRNTVEDLDVGVKALCSVIKDCLENPDILKRGAHSYEDLFE